MPRARTNTLAPVDSAPFTGKDLVDRVFYKRVRGLVSANRRAFG